MVLQLREGCRVIGFRMDSYRKGFDRILGGSKKLGLGFAGFGV